MPDWLLNMTLNWLWKEGVYPNTEKKSSGISQGLKQILVRRLFKHTIKAVFICPKLVLPNRNKLGTGQLSRKDEVPGERR